jgi:hypothetical protein
MPARDFAGVAAAGAARTIPCVDEDVPSAREIHEGGETLTDVVEVNRQRGPFAFMNRFGRPRGGNADGRLTGKGGVLRGLRARQASEH